MKVLDIGCGLGYDLQYLTIQLGIEPYGCDLLKSLESRKFNFVIADASYLPFKEDIFDIAYSLGTIEHTKRTYDCVSESFRVVKNKGAVLHTVPNFFSLHSLLARPLLKILGKWRIGLERSFSLASLHKMFKDNGFIFVQYLIIPFDTSVVSKQFRQFRLIYFFKTFDNRLSRIIPFWGHFIAMYSVKMYPDCPINKDYKESF
jgi:ubiquinone/menaquinone biosynthesis C-methylase UbiE